MIKINQRCSEGRTDRFHCHFIFMTKVMKCKKTKDRMKNRLEVHLPFCQCRASAIIDTLEPTRNKFVSLTPCGGGDDDDDRNNVPVSVANPRTDQMMASSCAKCFSTLIS